MHDSDLNLPETGLPKTFDPAAIEAKWSAHWESNGLFRPARPDAEPYTIVNPPPNVTGSLHIGHALDNTLQDIMIRYERLRGKDALWVVGMDHAGIATQMVVERRMEAQGDKRTNHSREDFIAKVWEWKAESGGTITGQLRRLGCSMDWSREQFTMDPHFTRAVTKVFVDLHSKGLIYRDKRLVNWDPKLKTAISDLEVETRETKGHFWHFRYPLADGVTLDSGADHIVVATTRPETMLADMAVAVNPADPRYQSVIGQHVVLPITGRRVPIIADDHADPALGSGAVKITPGHDFNDFEVGKRAGIEPADMLNMFDEDARVIRAGGSLIPDAYLGLDRFEARAAVVAAMKALGALVQHIDANGELHDAEPRTIQTPYGDRSGVVIEPWLTDQWYVDAATLAQPAIAAVRSGAVEIVPRSWEKTFFHWMENIQPWCISRQLWWGHRVPVWYGPKVVDLFGNGQLGFAYFAHISNEMNRNDPDNAEPTFVALSESEARAQAIQYYQERLGYELEVVFVQTLNEAALKHASSVLNRSDKRSVFLVQDSDVLDTWFSSALWPFATLGWPEQNPSPLAGEGQAEGQGEGLLARHYPNDLLISGFDILFFWDARMLMQGIECMGASPWKRLYLHGLVRAADGQKMSKSKGNVVDPLILIDRYGADALRFFMAAMESQGRDVKMDEARVEGYRNFATKLWNAARFAQANGIGASTSLTAPPAAHAVNRWMIGELVDTLAAMERALAELRFDAAADAIYHFVWDIFCDWYLELIKGAIDEETRAVAGWALDQILVMLHPFMPFITEEIWSQLGDRANYPLITALWPEPRATVDTEAKAEIEWLIKLVSEIRTAKAGLGLAPGVRLDLIAVNDTRYDPTLREVVIGERYDLVERFNKLSPQLNRIARLDVVKIAMTGIAIDLSTGLSVDRTSYVSGKGAKFHLVLDNVSYEVPLEGVIDVAAERARLTKAHDVAAKERDGLASRLANPAFTDKAKPEAVAKARADHAAKAAEAERLEAALDQLG